MNAAPEHAGTLYIDGHVRVYNGHQTKLPRHYVARQKLCLRATSDYMSKMANIAISMFSFSRWSQENFFKYTREHYNVRNSKSNERRPSII